MRILILLLLSAFITNSYAQEYWQQKVDYTISVELDDQNHYLNGKISINYTNNSPDTLDFIYFHLWPNAYKNEYTALCEQMLLQGNADLYYADTTKRGFISKIDFRINDKSLIWIYDAEHIDIAKVYLDKPLKPGESTTIKTPFRVKIPSSEFSRLGHSDQSYQITQWYPKPAVYDAEGWHQMPYLNLGEFYSEFGSYDVSIRLPENYVVGATGDMVNGEKENRWLDSIAEDTRRNVGFMEDESFPRSSSRKKTLVFHQDSVHDFAWFADKRYHVLRKEITLKSGHKVMLQSMFTNQEANLWMQSLTYLEQSTRFYSEFVGEYPYNHVTAVQGALSAGAGMEYPNITIIGLSNSKYVLEETIMHEVGHNWFYGLLAFNERDYPWMDEGINTFVQNQYMHKYHPDLSAATLYTGSNTNFLGLNNIGESYINYMTNRVISSMNLDQASGLHSSKYTSTNYGVSVYMKTSLSIDYLQNYLGKEEFSRIFKGFYEKWKYKHPQPNDLQNYFEKESGKDLSWLFDDLINSKKRVDYKISSVKAVGDSISITIKNKGEISSPVCISTKDNGGYTLQQKWVEGFEGKKEFKISRDFFHKISINTDYSLLDYNPNNNEYIPHKMFPKSPKLKLKFITSLPKANENYIYYTPVLGWNYYDKFMAGILVFNHSLEEKKWEYELMPMYSFNQNALSGSFGVHRNFYTKSFIRRLSIGIVGKRYHYEEFDNSNNLKYTKYSPEATLYFKNPAGNTNITHTARARMVYIEKDLKLYYETFTESSIYEPKITSHYYNLFAFDYKFYNNRKVNPYGVAINLQASDMITKASITLEYALSYNDKKKNSLELRFFAGKIFNSINDPYVDYSYKMSSYSGADDYLYDYTYMDRSQQGGFYSHQITPSDGGFFLPSKLGRGWDYIAALNVRTGLPFSKIIKLYANFGVSEYDKNLLAEGGVLITFGRTFELYLPILWTSQYQDVMDLNPDHKYFDNVRFTIRMDLKNPFKLQKELNL